MRPLRRLLALVSLAALPSVAHAQLRAVRALSYDAARAALEAAQGEARRQGWAVSIMVVDAAGEPVAFARMDGAPFSSANVARDKARSAARFRRPTKAFADAVAEGRVGVLALEGAVPVEGGVPITVEGQVVGAVGVSGVTSQQDAQVAQAGAAAVKP
jgi:uncharacterized protein GlcG (DUF336 family)